MILNLDDNRPHVVVQTDTGTHVIPMSFFDDVVAGKRLITDLEQWEQITPVIIREWMEKKS